MGLSLHSVLLYLGLLPALYSLVQSQELGPFLRDLIFTSEPGGIPAIKDQVPFSFGDSLHKLDWEPDDDYIEVPLQIPGCPAEEPYKFTVLPYNLLGTGFYDLAQPFNQSMNPTYRMYSFPSLDFNNYTYEREHVYEAQLITQFIDYLKQFGSSLYVPVNPNFCPWLKDNILTAGPGRNSSVLEDLRRCLPHNKGKTPSNRQMPWLQTITKTAKSSALNGTEVEFKDRFDKYSWSEKIAVMRGVAAVLPYLNNDAIAKEFKEQSACMSIVWNLWYIEYIAKHANDKPPPMLPGGPAGMELAYLAWNTLVSERLKLNIRTAVETMIDWFEVQAGGPQVNVDVGLDYASVLQQRIRAPRFWPLTVNATALRQTSEKWYTSLNSIS